MKILTFTTLFPNSVQPNNAIFVQHRMAAVNKLENMEVKVVAPVPWFPDISIGPERWRTFAQVPRREMIKDMAVYHPRYLVTPKVGMSLYGLSMFLGALPTVKRLFQKWPFDVIDAHYVYPDGFAALLLGRTFRRPVVVSARGTDMNLYPRLQLIRPLVLQVVTRADGLISVCRSLAENMIALGAERKKVRVVPNGIDPQLFYPMDQQHARDALGLKNNRRILISVGALRRLKGMHLLIESLKKLQKQGRLSFTTYIIGKGEMKKLLEEQVRALGLDERVVLVGEVPNAKLVYWYNAADLSFLGSSREGWPNVVCESLACGTPVVATPVDGIPDIIHSSQLGIIVNRNIDAFATGITQGFRHNWDREHISRQGQERTWGKVALDVAAMINEVCVKRQGR